MVRCRTTGGMQIMLLLNSNDLENHLEHSGLISCMANALESMSTNQATNFPRAVYDLNSNAALGFMPAMAPTHTILGYKAISVFHDNVKKGLNPHQGLVVLIDSETGLTKCLLEGSTLTALRTAAVSAAATALLSRPESSRLALIGSGRQAVEHVKAITTIRPIKTIFLYARTPYSAKKFIDTLCSQYEIDIVLSPTPRDAVQHADIVVTCTPSTQALLHIDDFSKGTHINAVGACRPGFQEITLIDNPFLKIYLDSQESCSLESDELSIPLKNKTLSPHRIVGELGNCIAKKIKGREAESDITFFKSIGLSIEDIYAAEYFYKKAMNMNIGQVVTL